MERDAINIVLGVIKEYETISPYTWLERCQAIGVSATDFVQSVAILESVHLVTFQTMINADGTGVQCYVLDKTPYQPRSKK